MKGKSNYLVYIVCTIAYIALIVAFINLFSFVYNMVTGIENYSINDLPSLVQIIIVLSAFYAAYGILEIIRTTANYLKR